MPSKFELQSSVYDTYIQLLEPLYNNPFIKIGNWFFFFFFNETEHNYNLQWKRTKSRELTALAGDEEPTQSPSFPVTFIQRFHSAFLTLNSLASSHATSNPVTESCSVLFGSSQSILA